MNSPTSSAALAAAPTTYEGTAARILEMLGNGLSPTVVASALGVTDSYVSQLLSEESFAQQVTALRFTKLQEATARDGNYDAIEDALIKKMQDLLPMMYKPMEILRAITVINQAKRRGAGAPENTVIHNSVVQLTLPAAITLQFAVNSNNQVIQAGDQELITIAAQNLVALKNGGKQNDTDRIPAAPVAASSQ